MIGKGVIAVCVAHALLWSGPASAQSAPGDPEAALHAWVTAFNECKVPEITALYAPEATFWGTYAGSLIASSEGVRFYFDTACAAQPRASVALGDYTVRSLGGVATIAGTYTFSRAGRDLPARFSFALLQRAGRWSIVQHHSSAMPTRP